MNVKIFRISPHWWIQQLCSHYWATFSNAEKEPSGMVKISNNKQEMKKDKLLDSTKNYLWIRYFSLENMQGHKIKSLDSSMVCTFKFDLKLGMFSLILSYFCRKNSGHFAVASTPRCINSNTYWRRCFWIFDIFVFFHRLSREGKIICPLR